MNCLSRVFSSTNAVSVVQNLRVIQKCRSEDQLSSLVLPDAPVPVNAVTDYFFILHLVEYIERSFVWWEGKD